MREVDAKFDLFEIVHVGAGDWATGGRGRDRKSPTGANPGDCARIQKRREQSQNVDENKAHHFLNVALGAFDAPMGTNQVLTGAKNNTIWKTREGSGIARRGRTGTKCRLDEIEVFQRRLGVARFSDAQTPPKSERPQISHHPCGPRYKESQGEFGPVQVRLRVSDQAGNPNQKTKECQHDGQQA